MKKARAAAAVLALSLMLSACAAAPADEALLSCTVSVDCSDVLAALDALPDGVQELIPEDGMMLRPITVEFSEGESAFDAFVTAAQTAKLQYETDGSGESAYLVGIGNLYAGDSGENSGWLFEVNGEMPSVSCGQYELEDGDEVVFRYVRDFMEAMEES